MARPMTDTLGDEVKAELAALTEAVEAAEQALTEATAARHARWVELVNAGASQSEVARASGVIRQAIGWALAVKDDPQG